MKIRRFLFAAGLAAAALVSAHATTVIPPTFDELVSEAQLIFDGTVTDVKSEWTGEGAERRIVSYVTFRVEDALKGNPGAVYTIRMLGGTVGADTMEVSDAPRFKAGDRDIVFVENNGKQFIPLVGIMFGRYRVQEDATTGRQVVATNGGQPIADLAELGRQDPSGHSHAAAAQSTGAAASAMDAASFKSAIRAKLAEEAQQ